MYGIPIGIHIDERNLISMIIDVNFDNLTGASEGVVRDIENKVMDNREKALNAHNHKISALKNGRYSTYVDDTSSKEGRRKLIAKSYDDLLDKLAAWYFPSEAVTPIKLLKGTFSLKDLYSEWSEQKFLTGRSTNAGRLYYSWKKYCLDEEISQKLINKPISGITTVELQRWVNALNDIYDFEIQQYFNATSPVRQMLEYAVEKNYIKENPFIKNLVSKDKFREKDEPEDETQVFFIDEVDELNKLADDGTVPGMAIRFMLLTGLRRAELIGLEYSDISRDGKYISINRQYIYDVKFDKNGKPIAKVPKLLNRTKTKSGKRKIYLVKDARKIIDEVKAYNEEHDLGGKFLFRSDGFEDFHLGYDAVERKLRRLCDKMQTIPKSQHKLRKTFISTLLDNGVNINVVKKTAGHKDERTTLANYCFNRRNPKQTEEQLEEALSLKKNSEKEALSA